MISLELAERLRDAGLSWSPGPGDRFVVPDKGMDDDVFVVSEMTIQVVELPHGSVIRFNGTTEWALDSIGADEVVWLPREAQLRDLLADRFVRLEAVEGGFAVVARTNERDERHVDIDAERAYARSVLAMLQADHPPSVRGT